MRPADGAADGPVVPVRPTDRAAQRIPWVAPWLVVAALLVATILCAAVVVESVRGIATMFLNPPTLAGADWVRTIISLSSKQHAFGIATSGLAVATGVAAVVAVAAAVLRRGALRGSAVWSAIPAIAGAVLIAVSLRLAEQLADTPSFDRIGVTGLLTASDARGVPSLAVTLGSAGMLILAATAGWWATRFRLAIALCVLAAIAGVLGAVAAVQLAAAPIDVIAAEPAYPARTLEPDPLWVAVGPVLALGAGAFALAALAAVAVRASGVSRPPDRPSRAGDPSAAAP